jgi:hypothetical protein
MGGQVSLGPNGNLAGLEDGRRLWFLSGQSGCDGQERRSCHRVVVQ